jgi:4-amino-4-deoxy-L-arabinose transferase-like glycosyltransferase
MPPHWDSGRHIFNTYQINDGVKSFIKYLAKIEIRQNGVVDSFRYILEYYGYYPNGVYYVGICFMAIFGKTIDSLLLSNFVWIILGFASILGISKQLGLTNSQKWLGLLFFFGNPFVIGQMREYQLDFPLLVMMLVATWQAIKFVNKRDFGTSIGLGFAIGFGFLVKWAFLYFVPFLLLILGYSLFVKRTFFQNAFQVICKLALSLVLAWSVIAPWYVHNLSQIYVDLTKNSGQTGIAEGDPQGVVGIFCRCDKQFLSSSFLANYFGWLRLDFN